MPPHLRMPSRGRFRYHNLLYQQLLVFCFSVDKFKFKLSVLLSLSLSHSLLLELRQVQVQTVCNSKFKVCVSACRVASALGFSLASSFS